MAGDGEKTNGFFGTLVDLAADNGNRGARILSGLMETDGYRQRKADEDALRDYRRQMRDMALQSAEFNLQRQKDTQADYEANRENRDLQRQSQNAALKNNLFQNNNLYADNLIKDEETAAAKILKDMQQNDPDYANLDDLSKAEFEKRSGRLQKEYIQLNRLYLKGQQDPSYMQAFDRYVSQNGWERVKRDGKEYLRNTSTGREEPLTLENGQEKLRQLTEDYKQSLAAYAQIQGPRDNVFKTLVADSLPRIGKYTSTMGQAQGILQGILKELTPEERNTAVFLHNLKQLQKGDYFNADELTSIYPQMVQLARKKGLRISVDNHNPLASHVEMPDGTHMGILDWASGQKDILEEKVAAFEEAGRQRQQLAAKAKLKSDVTAVREELGVPQMDEETQLEIKVGKAIAKRYGVNLQAVFKSRADGSKIKNLDDMSRAVLDAFKKGREKMLEEKDPSKIITAFNKGFSEIMTAGGVPEHAVPVIGEDADLDLKEEAARKRYREANAAREKFRGEVRRGKKHLYSRIRTDDSRDPLESQVVGTRYDRAEKEYSEIIEKKRQRREQKKAQAKAHQEAKQRMAEFYRRTLK